MSSVWPDSSLIKLAWNCKCPKCGKGDLYASWFDLSVIDKCSVCNLDLSKNDSADGPAVFLIFILGFTIVPIAILFDFIFDIPLWVHGVIWTILMLGITVGSLRPLKAYIIALQYKHRPRDLGEDNGSAS